LSHEFDAVGEFEIKLQVQQELKCAFQP